MHTSLEVLQAHCMRCEGACHTVPSPLAGEGQGEGWRQGTEPKVSPVQKDSRPTAGAHLLGHRYKTKAVRVVPPSLSLPRKGGGNHVAPLCPTANQRTRRCVHALARKRGPRATNEESEQVA